MKRREFITGLAGAAALPVVARAQPARFRRLGILSQGSINTHPTPLLRSFLTALSEAGWNEGQNLTIVWKFSEGSAEALPRMAKELVEQQVELIVASPTSPALAAKHATTTIPIVFIQVADPISAGIVSNLARPEGNVTGLSTVATDLAGKRLALLKELLPRVARVAVLWNKPSQGAALAFRELESASPKLGIKLNDMGISQASELDAALKALIQFGSEALIVIDDPVIAGYRDQIFRSEASRKLPIFSSYSEFTNSGGLMSYGPHLPNMYRRAATYVDRILRGTAPSELPIEQPATFALVINLKAAKALGLNVPATLLARADEVIE